MARTLVEIKTLTNNSRGVCRVGRGNGGFWFVFGYLRPLFGKGPFNMPDWTPQFHAARKLAISFCIVVGLNFRPRMPFAFALLLTCSWRSFNAMPGRANFGPSVRTKWRRCISTVSSEFFSMAPMDMVSTYLSRRFSRVNG